MFTGILSNTPLVAETLPPFTSRTAKWLRRTPYFLALLTLLTLLTAYLYATGALAVSFFSKTEITVFGHSQNSNQFNDDIERLPSWPTLMSYEMGFLSAYAVVANPSSAGAVMSQIQQQLTNYTRPVTSGKTAVATLWGLVNDAGTGRTAQQIQDAITTFAAAYKAKFPNGKLIVATEPLGHAENFYPFTNQQIYGVLAEVADWLRQGQPNIDVVVDLAADSRLDLTASGAGSGIDGLHLNESRRAIVGSEFMLPAIQAAMAGGKGIYTPSAGLVPYIGQLATSGAKDRPVR